METHAVGDADWASAFASTGTRPPAIDALLPDQAACAAQFGGLVAGALPGPLQVVQASSAVLTTLDGPTAVALASVGPLRANRASIPPMRPFSWASGATPGGGRLLPTRLFEGLYFDNRGHGRAEPPAFTLGTALGAPRRSAMLGSAGACCRRPPPAPSSRPPRASAPRATPCSPTSRRSWVPCSWGALSPVNDALDVGVGLALTWLLGWHWAFLPSFLSELIPIWDLVPTWTAAVWFVTSGTLPPAGGPPGPPIDVTPKAPPALKG